MQDGRAGFSVCLCVIVCVGGQRERESRSDPLACSGQPLRRPPGRNNSEIKPSLMAFLD